MWFLVKMATWYIFREDDGKLAEFFRPNEPYCATSLMGHHDPHGASWRDSRPQTGCLLYSHTIMMSRLPTHAHCRIVTHWHLQADASWWVVFLKMHRHDTLSSSRLCTVMTDVLFKLMHHDDGLSWCLTCSDCQPMEDEVACKQIKIHSVHNQRTCILTAHSEPACCCLPQRPATTNRLAGICVVTQERLLHVRCCIYITCASWSLYPNHSPHTAFYRLGLSLLLAGFLAPPIPSIGCASRF